MYFSPFYIYALSTLGAGIVSRTWVVFRRDRAARHAMNTPLFDESALARAFAPSSRDDDPNILAEMRTTFAHLNRQAYAQEFWNLDRQLVKYYQQIPRSGRETMERLAIRLIESPEKWLQIVGAKTCATLGIADAAEALTRAAALSAGDERFKSELDGCLRTLTER